MKDLKVSVIIPVYNTEAYLPQCLESALNQDLEELEVICVDDGSTDGSSSILADFSDRDSRVRVFTQSNKGQASARNLALKHAHGKYIVFLDSDDMLASGSLSQMYELSEANHLEILCYDTVVIEDESLEDRGSRRKGYYNRTGNYAGIGLGETLFTRMVEGDDFYDSVWVLFIRNQWLKDHRLSFYEGIFYEDALFCLQCYLQAERMQYVNRPFYIYRIREKSTMTSKAGSRNLYSYLVCFQEILKIILGRQLDTRLGNALLKYSKLIEENIAVMGVQIPLKARKEMLTSLDGATGVVAETFGISAGTLYEMNYQIQWEGFESELKDTAEIVIYGAGNVAKEVFWYLKGHGWHDKVSSFAVTETVSEHSIEHIPVKGIGDIVKDGQPLVLISSVQLQNQAAMYQMARDLGFQKIAVVDYRLEKRIQEYLSQKVHDEKTN